MDISASIETSRLASRVRGILLRPKAEWGAIAAEPATVAALYKGYVIPLAAIGPIATVIGQALFGVSVPFVGTFRVPIVSALTGAVVSYVLTLVGVYVTALIIDALAPTFGASKDPIAALKVAAYGSTAAWVAGIFAILPPLGVLSILGLYSLYLVYLGLPALMQAPAERALTYTVAVIVLQIVVYIVVGAAAGAFVRY